MNTFCGTEQAKCPPYPRCREHAGAVINDDGVGIGNTKRAGIAGKLLGARQHMRQRIGVVGNGVDVEAHRAGNVAGKIFGCGVARHGRKIERAVDHCGVGCGRDAQQASRCSPARARMDFRSALLAPACAEARTACAYRRLTRDETERLTMIARIWHGWTTPDNADAYETLLRSTILPGIVANKVAGLARIELFRRSLGAEVEFITIMWFDALAAVKAFAGAQYEEAVVPPCRPRPAQAFRRAFAALRGPRRERRGRSKAITFGRGPWSRLTQRRSARAGSACPSFRSGSLARRRFHRSCGHGCRRKAADHSRRSRSAARARCRPAVLPTWS